MTLSRPRSLTMVLLGINVAVFVIEMALGGSSDPRVLVRMGALVPALVVTGEYWRLITATFLHIGVMHLLLNAFGLYVFGSLVESALGSARFLAVYLVTGFCASATSFAFGDPFGLAAGASGSIFGLLGAWLAFNLRRRSFSLARANVQGALMLIGINLVLGFAIPGIDNLAHIGGLVAGVLAGFAAEGLGRRTARVTSQVAGLALLLAAGVALAAWRVGDLLG